MKTCTKCQLPGEFSRDKTRKDGYHPYCKSCVKVGSANYFETHRGEANARTKRWNEENAARRAAYFASAEVKEARRVYMKEYRRNNAVKLRSRSVAYDQERASVDTGYRLGLNLRKRLGTALRGNQKAGSAVRDLGCTIPELKLYLEKLFQPGMTWENWGRKGWHIDHIKPLASFDLTDREQFLKACHYTNLQPLWATENLRKSKY